MKTTYMNLCLKLWAVAGSAEWSLCDDVLNIFKEVSDNLRSNDLSQQPVHGLDVK